MKEQDPFQLVRDLFLDPPRLHRDGLGKPANWGIDPRYQPHFMKLLSPGMSTLEIGAGISTIAFLALGTRHTAITPDRDEIARIVEYCESKGIASGNLTTIFSSSSDALPLLPRDAVFDLILIDGEHAFPVPSVDWFYSVRHLKKGGILAVDDVQLWSGQVVADFMESDRGSWETLERSDKFIIGRLLISSNQVLGRGWQGQASEAPAFGGAPPLGSKALKRFLSLGWAPDRLRERYSKKMGGTVTRALKRIF